MNNPNKVYFNCDSNDCIPQRKTEGSAGFDLVSRVSTTLQPFQPTKIDTGTRLEMNNNYFSMVTGRSSLALKGFHVFPGTIDPDFRGNIQVIGTFYPISQGDTFSISRNDRIAQLLFYNKANVELEFKENLSETNRGTGGFGSTGIN